MADDLVQFTGNVISLNHQFLAEVRRKWYKVGSVSARPWGLACTV